MLDLAVLYLPIGEPDLANHRLASEELLLALSEGHRAAASTTVALVDVADEPFRRLRRAGESPISEIARVLGVSRITVKCALTSACQGLSDDAGDGDR